MVVRNFYHFNESPVDPLPASILNQEVPDWRALIYPDIWLILEFEKIFPLKSSVRIGEAMCFSRSSSTGKPCSLVSCSVSFNSTKTPI